jgi:hypothetical protein
MSIITRKSGLHRAAETPAAPAADLSVAPLIPLSRPATVTNDAWKKAVSGDWSTATDWSTGAVAGSSSAATISVAGTYTVTISTFEYANSLLISNATATVFDDGGNLSVTGALSLKAGTFNLGGSSAQPEQGAVSAASFVISSGATLSASYGGGFEYGAISNAGIIDVANTANATLLLQGGGALGTVTGSGSIELASGTYTDTIAALAKSGGVEIFSSGDLSLSGQSGTIVGPVDVFEQGILSIASSANLALSGAVLFGDGLSNDSNGGTLSGQGTLTTSGTTTIDAGYYASWQQMKLGGGITWINSGTVDDAGIINLGLSYGNDSASIFNQAGANFILTSNTGVINAASGAGTYSFTNAGTLSTTGAGYSDLQMVVNNAGLISIAAGSELELDGGGSLGGTISAPGTLALGDGTFTSSFGILSGIATLNVTYGGALSIGSATGTFAAPTFVEGDLAFTSGTSLTLSGASNINGGGVLSFANIASVTMTAPIWIDYGAGLAVGTMTSLAASGPIQFGDGLYNDSNGGTLSGQGTLTTSGTTTIDAGYYANWQQMKLGGGITWINSGIVDDAGIINLGLSYGNDSASIFNQAGANFILTSNTGAINAASGAGTYSFTNAGTLSTTGAGYSDLQMVVNNTGLISIAAGSELELDGGGSLGGTISGTGTLLLGEGSFTTSGLSGTGNVEIVNYYASLSVSTSGTFAAALALSGNGNLYVGSNANLTLSGAVTFGSGAGASTDTGYVSGPGTFTTSGTTTINPSAANTQYQELSLGGGVTWINSGTVNDTGIINLNTVADDSVTIINEAGANFNITAPTSTQGAGLSPFLGFYTGTNDTFTNAGTVSESGASGGNAAYLNMVFNNTGLLSIAAGSELFLGGGGGSLGGTISGAGTLALDGGGIFTSSANVFTGLSNLDIYDPTTLAISGGSGIASASIDLLSGTLSLATGTSLTLSKGSTLQTFNTGVASIISNSGTINDTGTVALGVATTDISNLANNAGGILNLASNNAQITTKGTATITNAGLIAKTGGSAQSVITGNVANNGTIEAATSSLKVSGSVTGTGVLKIDSGATLEIGNLIAAKEIVTFTGGAGATLKLDKPASLGTLAGFGAADRLDLAGITATHFSISGTVVTVTTSSTSYTYVSAGLAGDAIRTGSDGSGGVLVSIFREATASHSPEPLAFGNLHVGSTATLGLTVSNTAAADGYSENLDAVLGSATAGFSATGSAKGIAAGASNSNSFTVSAINSAAGTYTGTAILRLTSDGIGLDNNTTTTAIGTQTVNISAAFYAYAAAHFTSTSITLGNQHVGAVDSGVLTLGNTASANGYSENLDAAFGVISGSATDSGSATGIAAGGSSNALHVGLTTTGAGAESGTAKIVLTSDGNGIDGLGTTTLGTSTINVTGNVYAYAAGTLASSTITFANHHVGDVVSAQALSLTNGAAANGYSEALDAALSGAGAGITASGSLTGLAAGSTDSSSLLIGENTSASGGISGSVTLGLVSDGTGIDGLGTTTLASQTVAVSGGVYAYASGALASSTINLGVIHAGSSVSAALGLSNGALANGYAEALDAGLSGGSTGVLTSGSVAGLAAGASSNALLLGVDTTTTGSFTGTALLGLISDGTGIDGLGTTTLASQTVSITAIVDNYAVASIEDLSTGNTLTGTSTNETINLGSVLQGSTAVTVDLGVLNAAKGLSDLLGGTFSTVGSTTGFTNSGFGTFSGLGAGVDEHAQIVTLNTNAQGTFTETIVLASAGSNASGYSGALANETLTITGTVTPGGTNIYNLSPGPNTIVGATGLSDIFNAYGGYLNTRDSLTGNATTNVLNLLGGGVFDVNAPVLFANIPTINATEGQAAYKTLLATNQTVLLRDGVGETVNVAAGKAAAGNTNAEQITIYGGTGSDTINLASGADTVYLGTGAETVVLGGAKNAVYGGGGGAVVTSTVANAGASIVGTTTGSTTLNITTAGNVVLNAADTYLAVNLLAGSKLTMGKLGFISANGAAGTDTITAGAANQTLIGGKGDVLTGYTGGGDLFRGATAALNGNSIANWTTGDTLDITDMANAVIGKLTAGKLTIGNGSQSDTLTVKGVTGVTLAATNFTVIGSDGNGGTLIGWHS